MKERGVLFSAPMVRALRREVGPKTQTRRIVKSQLPTWQKFSFEDDVDMRELVFVFGEADGNLRPIDSIRCPYGQPGDRLWVREAYRFGDGFDAVPPRDVRNTANVWYEAEVGAGTQTRPAWVGKLRPGMFMPRWASRIVLEVTEVRIERLQDIGDDDAVAEGIEPLADGWRDYMDPKGLCLLPRTSYMTLWDSINGPADHKTNPWVWAVSFREVTP